MTENSVKKRRVVHKSHQHNGENHSKHSRKSSSAEKSKNKEILRQKWKSIVAKKVRKASIRNVRDIERLNRSYIHFYTMKTRIAMRKWKVKFAWRKLLHEVLFKYRIDRIHNENQNKTFELWERFYIKIQKELKTEQLISAFTEQNNEKSLEKYFTQWRNKITNVNDIQNYYREKWYKLLEGLSEIDKETRVQQCLKVIDYYNKWKLFKFKILQTNYTDSLLYEKQIIDLTSFWKYFAFGLKKKQILEAKKLDKIRTARKSTWMKLSNALSYRNQIETLEYQRAQLTKSLKIYELISHAVRQNRISVLTQARQELTQYTRARILSKTFAKWHENATTSRAILNCSRKFFQESLSEYMVGVASRNANTIKRWYKRVNYRRKQEFALKAKVFMMWHKYIPRFMDVMFVTPMLTANLEIPKVVSYKMPLFDIPNHLSVCKEMISYRMKNRKYKSLTFLGEKPPKKDFDEALERDGLRVVERFVMDDVNEIVKSNINKFEFAYSDVDETKPKKFDLTDEFFKVLDNSDFFSDIFTDKSPKGNETKTEIEFEKSQIDEEDESDKLIFEDPPESNISVRRDDEETEIKNVQINMDEISSTLNISELNRFLDEDLSFARKSFSQQSSKDIDERGSSIISDLASDEEEEEFVDEEEEDLPTTTTTEAFNKLVDEITTDSAQETKTNNVNIKEEEEEESTEPATTTTTEAFNNLVDEMTIDSTQEVKTVENEEEENQFEEEEEEDLPVTTTPTEAFNKLVDEITVDQSQDEEQEQTIENKEEKQIQPIQNVLDDYEEEIDEKIDNEEEDEQIPQTIQPSDDDENDDNNDDNKRFAVKLRQEASNEYEYEEDFEIPQTKINEEEEEKHQQTIVEEEDFDIPQTITNDNEEEDIEIPQTITNDENDDEEKKQLPEPKQEEEEDFEIPQTIADEEETLPNEEEDIAIPQTITNDDEEPVQNEEEEEDVEIPQTIADEEENKKEEVEIPQTLDNEKGFVEEEDEKIDEYSEEAKPVDERDVIDSQMLDFEEEEEDNKQQQQKLMNAISSNGIALDLEEEEEEENISRAVLIPSKHHSSSIEESESLDDFAKMMRGNLPQESEKDDEIVDQIEESLNKAVENTVADKMLDMDIRKYDSEIENQQNIKLPNFTGLFTQFLPKEVSWFIIDTLELIDTRLIASHPYINEEEEELADEEEEIIVEEDNKQNIPEIDVDINLPGLSDWLTRTYTSVAARIVPRVFWDLQPQWPLEFKEETEEDKEFEIMNNLISQSFDGLISGIAKLQPVNFLMRTNFIQRDPETENILDSSETEEESKENETNEEIETQNDEEENQNEKTQEHVNVEEESEKEEENETKSDDKEEKRVIFDYEPKTIEEELPDECEHFTITLDETLVRDIDEPMQVLQNLLEGYIQYDFSTTSTTQPGEEQVRLPDSFSLSLESTVISVVAFSIDSLLSNISFQALSDEREERLADTMLPTLTEDPDTVSEEIVVNKQDVEEKPKASPDELNLPNKFFRPEKFFRAERFFRGGVVQEARGFSPNARVNQVYVPARQGINLGISQPVVAGNELKTSDFNTETTTTDQKQDSKSPRGQRPRREVKLPPVKAQSSKENLQMVSEKVISDFEDSSKPVLSSTSKQTSSEAFASENANKSSSQNYPQAQNSSPKTSSPKNASSPDQKSSPKNSSQKASSPKNASTKISSPKQKSSPKQSSPKASSPKNSSPKVSSPKNSSQKVESPKKQGFVFNLPEKFYELLPGVINDTVTQSFRRSLDVVYVPTDEQQTIVNQNIPSPKHSPANNNDDEQNLASKQKTTTVSEEIPLLSKRNNETDTDIPLLSKRNNDSDVPLLSKRNDTDVPLLSKRSQDVDTDIPLLSKRNNEIDTDVPLLSKRNDTDNDVPLLSRKTVDTEIPLLSKRNNFDTNDDVPLLSRNNDLPKAPSLPPMITKTPQKIVASLDESLKSSVESAVLNSFPTMFLLNEVKEAPKKKSTTAAMTRVEVELTRSLKESINNTFNRMVQQIDFGHVEKIAQPRNPIEENLSAALTAAINKSVMLSICEIMF